MGNSKSVINSDTVIRNSIRTRTHIFLIFITTATLSEKENINTEFFLKNIIIIMSDNVRTITVSVTRKQEE